MARHTIKPNSSSFAVQNVIEDISRKLALDASSVRIGETPRRMRPDFIIISAWPAKNCVLRIIRRQRCTRPMKYRELSPENDFK